MNATVKTNEKTEMGKAFAPTIGSIYYRMRLMGDAAVKPELVRSVFGELLENEPWRYHYIMGLLDGIERGGHTSGLVERVRYFIECDQEREREARYGTSTPTFEALADDADLGEDEGFE